MELLSTRRSRRTSPRALRSSSVLATHTVQVTSDAKARPMITALTTRSEFSNMPQGERSCGRSAPLIMCSPGSAAEAGAAGADAAGGGGAGADAGGAVVCAGWGGAALAGVATAGAGAAGAGETAGAPVVVGPVWLLAANG